MIKKLSLKNFTVFSNEQIEFSQGINVIIGENGSGKSHLLKLLYSVSSISKKMGLESIITKQILQKNYAAKLTNVFKPDNIGRLVKRSQGRNRCEIEINYNDQTFDINFSFATNSRSDVTVKKAPSNFFTKDFSSIFIPTRELVSIFPGFASLYRTRSLEFDETYFDLCLNLEAPLLKGPRLNKIKHLIEPLEKIMGGSIRCENNRFYLHIPGKGNMEIQLVAEGIRKFAMLAFLITNGTLNDNSIIFWDEPETNLNPKLIKSVAKVLYDLSLMGMQIFIATHSLFLLREIEMLSFKAEYKKVSQRYMGLELNGKVSQGNIVDDIDVIHSLDEELTQSDRYIDAIQGTK